MGERFTPSPSYRGTFSGDGRPGPIEQRIGRRLVRLIDPESEEGLRLLDAGRVELIGPDGDPMGCISPPEAYGRLLARLERRLDEVDSGLDRAAVEDELGRARAWSERLRSPRIAADAAVRDEG